MLTSVRVTESEEQTRRNPLFKGGKYTQKLGSSKTVVKVSKTPKVTENNWTNSIAKPWPKGNGFDVAREGVRPSVDRKGYRPEEAENGYAKKPKKRRRTTQRQKNLSDISTLFFIDIRGSNEKKSNLDQWPQKGGVVVTPLQEAN